MPFRPEESKKKRPSTKREKSREPIDDKPHYVEIEKLAKSIEQGFRKKHRLERTDHKPNQPPATSGKDVPTSEAREKMSTHKTSRTSAVKDHHHHMEKLSSDKILEELARRLSERFSKRPMQDSQGESSKSRSTKQDTSLTKDSHNPKSKESSNMVQKRGPSPKRNDGEQERRNSRSQGEEQVKPETHERLGPKINMRFPEVRGEKIKTHKQLHELLDSEYSSLKTRSDFPKRIMEAESHLDLIHKYGSQERISRDKILELANELNLDTETIRLWMTKKRTPRLYHYMNLAKPKTEASARVERIINNNTGIRSLADIDNRLDSYYFGNAEQNTPHYERELRKAQIYFEFLETYKDGGLIIDISRKVGLSPSGAQSYLSGGKPWLVRLATQIPREKPQHGFCWFPLKTTGWGVRKDFIQVPLDIQSFQDIQSVLNQLKPLISDKMRNLGKRFGDISKEEAFMYCLGIFVSDSGVQTKSTSTQAIVLGLSKKHKWNQQIGDAVGYYLGKIGIDFQRKKDRPPTSDVYNNRTIQRSAQFIWKSGVSTTLRWVWKSVLGYDDAKPKSQQSINAPWILNSPKDMRIAFLQGLADGDGSASTKGKYLCITTKHNQNFVKELLSSLGVNCRITRTDVVTSGYSAAVAAARLPMFRFAEGRVNSSKRVVEMILATRHVGRHPLNPKELNFIINEWKRGLSSFDICEKFFDKFGTSIHHSTIERIAKKHLSKDE